MAHQRFDSLLKELVKNGIIKTLLVTNVEKMDYNCIGKEKRQEMEEFTNSFQALQELCFQWEIENAYMPKTNAFLICSGVLVSILLGTLYEAYIGNIIGIFLGTFSAILMLLLTIYYHSQRGYHFRNKFMKMDNHTVQVIEEHDYKRIANAGLHKFKNVTAMGKVYQESDRSAVLLIRTGLKYSGFLEVLGLPRRKLVCKKIQLKLISENDSLVRYKQNPDTIGDIPSDAWELYTVDRTSLARYLYESDEWNNAMSGWERYAVEDRILEAVKNTTFVVPLEPIATPEEMEMYMQDAEYLKALSSKNEKLTQDNAEKTARNFNLEVTVAHQSEVIDIILKEFEKMIIKIPDTMKTYAENTASVSESLIRTFGIHKTIANKVVQREMKQADPMLFVKDMLEFTIGISKQIDQMKGQGHNEEVLKKIEEKNEEQRKILTNLFKEYDVTIEDKEGVRRITSIGEKPEGGK